MMNDTLVEQYEDTMKILNNFMKRAGDGTFTFIMSKDEHTNLDPNVVYDLLRSVAHTNYLIKEGILDPLDITH